MLYGGICVLVDVECTIGQSRCTAEIKSTLAILVENTGVGTGYRRSYAVCVRVEACSDTAHTLSAIILFVAVILAIKVCKLRQCCFIDSIVFDVVIFIVQRSIKDTKVFTCGFAFLDILQRFISRYCHRFIIRINSTTGYKLLRTICFRVVRIRFRRISNLAVADSCAPGIFVDSFICI